MALDDCPPPIRTYFASVNDEAFEDLRDVMVEDVTVEPCGMDPVHGLDDAIDHYAWLLAPFPEHHDEPVRVLPSGDTVTVEIDFTGTTDEGRTVAFRAVDVFDLVDGRIARVAICYDTAGVRRQLRA